jgi:uncharacterized protein (UPF0335 family)
MADVQDHIPEELGGNARVELEEYISRIESLEGERAQVSEKIKAEYAEAGGSGFDKKALKQIIKERADADVDKTIKHRRIVELYRRALSRSKQATFGDWARGWITREAKTSIDEGETADPKLAEFLKGRKQQKDTGNPASDAS